MKRIALGVLVLALPPAAALAMDDQVTKPQAAIEWMPAPPALPPGAQLAVLAGDPTANTPFVIRIRIPAAYKIGAHTHPTDENLTVISGTFHVGMGAKLDTNAGTALGPGGFAFMPHGMQHYAWSDGPAEVQVHGMGPFVVNYVDPADDPRGMTAQTPQDNSATTGSK